MRQAFYPVVLLLLLFVACAKQQEPTLFQVGEQKVTLLPPADWEYVNYGDQHQWRRDFERITLIDLGRRGSYLELASKRGLEQLGENERREVARRDTITVSGREAWVVDTWETVSHQYPKRYLFVINERSLLALYTMQGKFENMAEAFDGMAASLAFADSAGHQP